jgi:hypothetical protein
LRENIGASTSIDVGEFRRAQAGAETERDDSTGRGSGDQIEISGDGRAAEISPFEFG